MISLKKWEIVLIGAALIAAVALRFIGGDGENPALQMAALALLMLIAAVLFLRKPLFILMKYFRIKRKGLRAEGVTKSYDHAYGSRRRTVEETIAFVDENGKTRTVTLPDSPMLTEKKGRKCRVYYLPDNETEFFIAPHFWVTFRIDTGFGLLAEGVLTAALISFLLNL